MDSTTDLQCVSSLPECRYPNSAAVCRVFPQRVESKRDAPGTFTVRRVTIPTFCRGQTTISLKRKAILFRRKDRASD